MPKLLPDLFREGQDAYARGLTLDRLFERAFTLYAEADIIINTADGDELAAATEISENGIPSLLIGFFDGLVAAVRRIDRA